MYANYFGKVVFYLTIYMTKLLKSENLFIWFAKWITLIKSFGTELIVSFTLLLRKFAEKSSKENLTVIKYASPNKLGNSESLKNNHNLKISSSNVNIVGGDLLRVFYKLIYLQFCVSSDQWKYTVSQILCSRLYAKFERDFYMKIIACIIPTNLFTNSLLSFFYPFIEKK